MKTGGHRWNILTVHLLLFAHLNEDFFLFHGNKNLWLCVEYIEGLVRKCLCATNAKDSSVHRVTGYQ